MDPQPEQIISQDTTYPTDGRLQSKFTHFLWGRAAICKDGHKRRNQTPLRYASESCRAFCSPSVVPLKFSSSNSTLTAPLYPPLERSLNISPQRATPWPGMV